MMWKRRVFLKNIPVHVCGVLITEQSLPFLNSTAPCWSLDGLSCSLPQRGRTWSRACPQEVFVCILTITALSHEQMAPQMVPVSTIVRANLNDLSSIVLLKTATLSLSECHVPPPKKKKKKICCSHKAHTYAWKSESERPRGGELLIIKKCRAMASLCSSRL